MQTSLPFTVIAVAAAFVAVAAGGWAALAADERRAARVVGAAVTRETGVPLTVGAASLTGGRVILRDLRLSPETRASFEVRARTLEVATDDVAVRHRLAATHVALASGRDAASSASALRIRRLAVDPAAPAAPMDEVRLRLRTLMEGPGALRLRLSGGELRHRGVTYAFDVTGEKRGGNVTIALTVRDARQPTGIELAARATPAAGDAVDITIDAAGRGDQVAALFPAWLAVQAPLTSRTVVTLRRGDAVVAGRLTVGAAASPAAFDYAGRYDAQAGRVQATAASAGGDGRLDARLSYAVGTGAFEGEINVARFDASALSAQLGVVAPPGGLRAAALSATLTGALGDAVASAAADVRAREVTAFGVGPVDGALTARARVTRGTDGLELAALERSTLTFSRDGGPVAVVVAASPPGRAWPVTVDGRVDDFARVAPLLGADAVLAGTARLVGEVRRAESVGFIGRLDARLDRARVTLRGPVEIVNARAAVPVTWSAPAPDEPGSFFVEQARIFRLAVERVLGTPRFVDGLLAVPDIAYTHYGGHGGGWLEAAVDGRPLPVRTRVDAEHIDLDALVRELGSAMGRVTGRVSYFVSAQASPAEGLVAVARMQSEGDGGEISIDALQRLLESPAVEVESTGLLRRTLENLRVFEYQTLTGELRYAEEAGYIDLSLRGKKRFGIFPAPVEAINIRHMPLAVLERAFGGGTTP